MRVVIDTETDNLLQEVTKIHCMAAENVDGSWSELYVGHEQILAGLEKLKKDDVELVGHNIFCYDLPVLKKILNWEPRKEQKIHDTLVLGQLLFSDIKNDDFNNTHNLGGKVFSKRDYGSHSLKAYGQRIMMYKGEYEGGWDTPNEDMFKYCIMDVKVCKKLFQILESRIPDKLLNNNAIDLEYSIAPILARLQAHGVLFDKVKADELIGSLTSALVEANWKLQDIFKPRFVSQGSFIPKRNDKSRGYVAGREFTKIMLEEFNPGSRTQIVDRLIKEYKWNPEEFTEKGNAKMDEDIIENLPFKELAPLKTYLTIKKRISQIETGRQAWINKIDKDGRIRGSIRQNGAVTGRMAHFGPNMAQWPSNESLYGKECRELVIASPCKVMVGVDADALEMRCLAGYLTPLDGGRFTKSLLEGKKEDGTDPHTLNMLAYGVEDRDCAKTLYYASLYGAKNAKLGAILMEYGVDFQDYVEDFDKSVKGMIAWIAKKNAEDREKGKDPMERTEAYWSCWVAGKECNKRYGDKIPELGLLNQKISDTIDRKGYIKGLDGRKLFCRTKHGALNTVLQSAGAIIMKKALYLMDVNLQKEGLVTGKDYEFILIVHDEVQLEVKNEQIIVDKVRRIVENSIKEAGEFFNFPTPMKGNSEQGQNWSLTH